MGITGGIMSSDRGRFNLKAQRDLAKRRRKAATDHRIIIIATDTLSSEARKLPSTPPLLPFMKYIPPLVLALVTLKYQGKPEILFWKNPVPVWCFITATSVYWLIVGAMKKMTTIDGKWLQIASRASLASGVHSALSLVSIFTPYPVSLVPLMIWIPLPAVLGWPILYKTYNLLHRGIMSVINKIQAMSVWARGLNRKEEASVLV